MLQKEQPPEVIPHPYIKMFRVKDSLIPIFINLVSGDVDPWIPVCRLQTGEDSSSDINQGDIIPKYMHIISFCANFMHVLHFVGEHVFRTLDASLWPPQATGEIQCDPPAPIKSIRGGFFCDEPVSNDEMRRTGE